MKCWYAGLALLTAAPVALADRGTGPAAVRADVTASFERTSADVETVKRDSKGRELTRTIQRWNKDTIYQGKTVLDHTWKGDRRTEVKVTDFDADNHIRTIDITKFSESTPGRPHVESRLTTGDWTLIRTEVSDTEPAKDGSVLTTTVVRDGQDALVETRYTLSRVVAGTTGRAASNAFTSSDTSVYDASNVQKSRTLIEWRGHRMDRWTFDENDEIRERETENRTVDGRGRTLTVSSDTFDGQNTQIAGREEQLTYGGPNEALSEHVATWYDGHGTGTQRRTSRTLFQGGQPTGARVTWETWVTAQTP